MCVKKSKHFIKLSILQNSSWKRNFGEDSVNSFEEYAAVIDFYIGEYNERLTDFEIHDITLKLAYHQVDASKSLKKLQMESIKLSDDISKSLFDVKKVPMP